ncbi:MAG: SDR family oxidoreductase [bacterium]|nr:SDR family oxidoreductase [Candidatus Kapabacteria bacterium]
MSNKSKPAAKRKTRPAQKQNRQPGIEAKMKPRPRAIDSEYQGSNKLKDKVAIITGGDSGIGRAVAVLFAREGADVAISYLDEHVDAKETQRMVEAEGRRCTLIAGDISREAFCRRIVERTIKTLGRIDVIVNNAAVQFPQDSIVKISAKQLELTFRTNVFAMFYLTSAALPHMRKGAAIVNSTSVTAYRGSKELIDYASTKGAIVAFTRSLAGSLVERGIRVNAVAPGPIWTPLIVSSFDRKKIQTFGSDSPMKRPGEPEEVAPSYVFLACDDSSYMTGQVLHPNGGEIING